MTGLLAPLGGAPDPGDLLVLRAGAQRGAQVRLLAGEQAGAHATFSSQPGAAAVRAERPGDRGDHAHAPALRAAVAVGDLEELGGGTVTGLRHWGELVAG